MLKIRKLYTEAHISETALVLEVARNEHFALDCPSCSRDTLVVGKKICRQRFRPRDKAGRLFRDTLLLVIVPICAANPSKLKYLVGFSSSCSLLSYDFLHSIPFVIHVKHGEFGSFVLCIPIGEIIKASIPMSIWVV